MASVSISYTFADGDEVTAKVIADTGYPDGLSQARVEALHAFATALAYTTADESHEHDS